MTESTAVWLPSFAARENQGGFGSSGVLSSAIADPSNIIPTLRNLPILKGQCLNCMDEQEYDLTVPANKGDLIHVKGPERW